MRSCVKQEVDARLEWAADFEVLALLGLPARSFASMDVNGTLSQLQTLLTGHLETLTALFARETYPKHGKSS
jgi:hypothetical protein